MGNEGMTGVRTGRSDNMKGQQITGKIKYNKW